MTALAVIPARLDSFRLPRKPLALIGDKPMVQWVYDAAVASNVFDDVVVATDNSEIADCVVGFGGRVEMTAATHRSGTDRVAEVAQRFPADFVANVQGDQPFATADALRALMAPFSRDEPAMTTVACPLDDAGRRDTNVVKVVCARSGDALIFTRAVVPHGEITPDVPVFHHLGLYAFTRQFLAEYATLPPTPLERCESLEQLRALEHGYRIQVSVIAAPLLEVNTQADLEAARELVGRR